jgi:hypothetical protein
MRLFCLVLAVSALSCLGAKASAETQTKWKPFQPSGDGYRIEFPGVPTVKRDALPSRVGPAPHVEADLTSKGFSYSVELTTYASPSDPEAVLDLMATFAAKAGKVRSQTRLNVGADPARRFEIEIPGGKFIATMLVVTDGTRVYQILCTSSRGQENSTSVKRFTNSFALVQQ